jgi:hypothetical protein
VVTDLDGEILSECVLEKLGYEIVDFIEQAEDFMMNGVNLLHFIMVGISYIEE